MLGGLFTWRSQVVRQTTRQATKVHRGLAALSSQRGPTEAEYRDARTWLSQFNADIIPKNACEVSFSRSSGPGGQNVNK